MADSSERALPSSSPSQGTPSVRGNRDEPAGAKVGERTPDPCAPSSLAPQLLARIARFNELVKGGLRAFEAIEIVDEELPLEQKYKERR